MCDLKSFSFSHHFGSGFKYFSAVIICKLSKILNLRLSGELIYKYTYIYKVFRKGLRERICRKVSESLVYLCIFVHFSLELVSRFKSGKGGGMVAVKHTSYRLHNKLHLGISIFLILVHLGSLLQTEGEWCSDRPLRREN